MNGSLRTWLLLTLAGCVLAATAVSAVEFQEITCPFGICNATEGHSLRVQAVVTRVHGAVLATAYREAADLALAARVLPRGRTVGEPELWFAADIPEVARKSVRGLLDSERATRGAWHGKGRVAVLVVADTARFLAGRSYARPWPAMNVRALLPSPETDGRCVAVIRLRASALTTAMNWNPARPMLDACAFFDAFGEPGPAIYAALDSGGFNAARLYLPGVSDSVRQLRDRNSVLAWYRDDDTDRYLCAAGQDAACARLVLSGTTTRRDRTNFYSNLAAAPAVARLPVTAEDDDWRNGATMDAVAATLGPERFARFWRSPEPLAVAFQTVAGRSIGSLAKQHIGAWYLPKRSPTGFGMRATTTRAAMIGSTALTAALIGALALLAMTGARRPTVA